MRRIGLAGPSWACELCHNRNNPSSSIVCSICSATRPVHRFGLQIEGKYYLCVVKSKSFTPSVAVFEVSGQECKAFTLDIEHSDCSLEESIVAAIVEYSRKITEEKLEICITPNDSDSTLLPQQLQLSPALSTGPKKGSKKQRPPKNLLANSSTPTHASGSFLAMFDPGMSLFDTVMHNAASFAYDAKIGQYVSVGTLSHATDDAQTPKDNMVKKNLDYIELMKKERTVMSQVVKEVVKRRADDTSMYDTQNDLDINRSEWDKNFECAMCERSYPKSQMPGQISFKAIVDWKASHDAAFPESDHRLSHVRLHDATRLCAFCTQFFDADAGNLADKQAIKDSIGVGDIGMDGPLNVSNTVYKKMFRKGVLKQKALEEGALSKMQHRVALDTLRFKAQNKNKDARFLFNPKVANSIVDQDKVGSFLRNKYVKNARGLSLSALTVPESKPSKSNKVALKPVSSSFLTDTNDQDGGGAEGNQSTGIDKSNGRSNNATVRSSSAGLTSTASTVKALVVSKERQHPALQQRKSEPARMHSKPFGAPTHPKKQEQTRSNNKTTAHIDILDDVLRAEGKDKVSTSELSPTKRRRKPREGNNVADDTGDAPKMRRSKTINGPTVVRERKPLILKVNSSVVIEGSQNEVLEIELAGAASKTITIGDTASASDTRSLSVGPASNKSEISIPLKGLLQNMQLRRRGTDGVLVPRTDIITLNALSDVHSKTVPNNNEIKKSVRIEDENSQTQDRQKPAQLPPLPAKKPFDLSATSPTRNNKGSSLPFKQASDSPKGSLVKKLKPLQNAYSKPIKKAAPQNQLATWKHNLNKPVLRDVFDTNSPSAQRALQDSSYITHVPSNDEFLMDEAYSDDAAEYESDAGSVPSVASKTKYPVTPPVVLQARSDSFASEYSYNDPFESEDPPEEDIEENSSAGSPSALEWDQLGSIDTYNWVSAGPYMPNASDTAAADCGFSPVNHGPNSMGSHVDRIRMLSRGSANGLLSPGSRAVSTGTHLANRLHTPKVGLVVLDHHPGPAAKGSTIEEDRYHLRARSRGRRASAGMPSPARGPAKATGIHYLEKKDASKVVKPVAIVSRANSDMSQIVGSDEEPVEGNADKPRRRTRF